MTNEKINRIWKNARFALATAEMLLDMLDMEADPETGELVLGEPRRRMYYSVLASVCGQIEEIADTICKE